MGKYVSKKRSEYINITKFHGFSGDNVRMSLDKAIIKELPKLDLPYMPNTARIKFRNILEYEKSTGNNDVLELAQARGFCAHPSDWVPSFEDDSKVLSIYQPLITWLAKNKHIPFYPGIELTEENLDFFTPNDLRKVFKNLLRKNRPSAYNLLMTVGVNKSAQVRYDLLSEVNALAMFKGLYPSDVLIHKHFLNDRSEKVRALAKEWLNSNNGLETEQDHANKIIKFFKLDGNKIVLVPDQKMRVNVYHPFKPYEKEVIVSIENVGHLLMKHFLSTSIDTLANAFRITSAELVRYWDLDIAYTEFYMLLNKTGNPRIRSIVVERLIEENKHCDGVLLEGIIGDVWERALNATYKSQYPSSVFDFPNFTKGSLTYNLIRKVSHYNRLAQSITDELKDGKLPVNIRYDPLRILGLLANKNAAKDILTEAISIGIDPNNPRLTMLKFNIAL